MLFVLLLSNAAPASGLQSRFSWQIGLHVLLHISRSLGFKTGLEKRLICNQCISTHPGCEKFTYKWHWGVECPRAYDKCVKLIERKGVDILITRDCLSNLEGHRVDIPADKYEGCHAGNKDVKLGQYTFNSIPELDVKRQYYDNITWCFCSFDHWCNSSPISRVNYFLLFAGLFAVLHQF